MAGTGNVGISLPVGTVTLTITATATTTALTGGVGGREGVRVVALGFTVVVVAGGVLI